MTTTAVRFLPFVQHLQFLLSHQGVRASPERNKEQVVKDYSVKLQTPFPPFNRFVGTCCCGCVTCCSNPRTDLQSDWAWGSGESSRPFVSLLSEETLLTSGARLSVRTLDTDSHGVRDTGRFSGLSHPSDTARSDTIDELRHRRSTYRRTGRSDGSLGSGRSGRALKRTE